LSTTVTKLAINQLLSQKLHSERAERWC